MIYWRVNYSHHVQRLSSLIFCSASPTPLKPNDSSKAFHSMWDQTVIQKYASLKLQNGIWKPDYSYFLTSLTFRYFRRAGLQPQKSNDEHLIRPAFFVVTAFSLHPVSPVSATCWVDFTRRCQDRMLSLRSLGVSWKSTARGTWALFVFRILCMNGMSSLLCSRQFYTLLLNWVAACWTLGETHSCVKLGLFCVW